MAQVCFNITDWRLSYSVGLRKAKILDKGRLLYVVAKSGLDVIITGDPPIHAYGEWYTQTIRIFDKPISLSYEKQLLLLLSFRDPEQLCVVHTKAYDNTEALGNLKMTERGLTFEGEPISDTKSRRLYTKLLVLTK